MAEKVGIMEGSVLDVADHLRINRPWIRAPGSAAEIANRLGYGAARGKISSFGHTSNGGQNTTAEPLGEPGNQVAESMKRQGDSIFDWAIVHLSSE